MNVTVELADLRALQERVEALENVLQRAVQGIEAESLPPNTGRNLWLEEAKTLLAQSEQWQHQEQAEPDTCPHCGNHEGVVPVAMAEGARFLRCPACGTTWEVRGG